MNGETATSTVIDGLEAMGVDYMLVGSFSSNFYGIPRATQDADFVVQLGQTSISACGWACRIPRAIACAASNAVSEPLKLSGAQTIRMVVGCQIPPA